MSEPITAIVTTLNEERNIGDCLQSLAWADEILLVDAGSGDRTLEIAGKFKARVLEHEYENAAAQKNWALTQAKHDWVLIVDADERLSAGLQDRLKAILAGEMRHCGYYVRRQNYFFGKRIRHCGWQRDYVLRLFDRRRGQYEKKRVHAGVVVEGKAGTIEEMLLHYTYRDFGEYFERFDRYTTWAAQDLFDEGKRAGFFNLFVRPVIRFCKQYFLHLGLLDGRAGLVLCMLSSYSVFTKYARLWQMRRSAAGQED